MVVSGTLMGAKDKKQDIKATFILVIHVNGDKVSKIVFEEWKLIKWVIKCRLDDYIIF